MDNGVKRGSHFPQRAAGVARPNRLAAAWYGHRNDPRTEIFVRNRIATHYHDLLAATLSAVVGRPLRIEVVTERSGVGRRP
jgi:hypothetical protein